MTSFCDEMEKRALKVWQAIYEHPFVVGIGSGSLDLDRYGYYLKQDYVYLLDFSRVFALASAKARTLDNMGYFASLLDLTLNTEMDLHKRTCAKFGIAAEELENTEPAMATLAYTSFLIKSCYEETMPGILSVLLPCAWGYAEIGCRLKDAGLPQVPHYREWIETYSSDDFVNGAQWLRDRLDVLARGASLEMKNRWYDLYLQSAKFELMFFEMGWQQESWPKVVPV
jgi:thiaminase/transcriptional activator TenA